MCPASIVAVVHQSLKRGREATSALHVPRDYSVSLLCLGDPCR